MSRFSAFFKVMVFAIFMVLSLCSFHGDKEGARYLIHDGFFYKPNTYDSTVLYEGGAWSLYYHLEQEVSVGAQYRRFLKGQLIMLFQLDFNGTQGPEVSLVERYFWYNIDNMARPVVEKFREKIATAPGWKKEYKGIVLLPIKFVTMGGRIGIDYNSFVTEGIGYAIIGKK